MEKKLNRDDFNLRRNILLTFVIKGLAVLISLSMTPSYIRYFQNDSILGVWFTIIAILNWIMVFDFGIGNGLRNELITTLEKKDKKKTKELVSSAYIAVSLISIVLIIVLSYLIKKIDWITFFGLQSSTINEKSIIISLQILMIGTVVNFLLKLITSILNAMQKTAVPNLLTLITTILMLIFINIFTFNGSEEKLISASFAQAFFLNLPLLVSTLIIFNTTLKYARPSINNYNNKTAKVIISIGGLFFVVQLGLLILNSTNEIVIISLYSASEVVEYQIYSKLYFFIITILSLVTQPIWSAVTKAKNDENVIRIKKLFRIILTTAVLGSLAAVFLTVGLQMIIDFWLADETIIVNYRIAISFMILVIVQLFINATTTIANGLGKLKYQVIFTSLAAFFKIPTIYLLRGYMDGVDGVVWVNVFLLLPLLVAQTIDIYKTVYRK